MSKKKRRWFWQAGQLRFAAQSPEKAIEAKEFVPSKMDKPTKDFITGPEDPRFTLLLISKKAYDKMLLYVNNCPIEISWLGTVTALEGDMEGFLLLDDVYLLAQQNTGTTTRMPSAAQQEFIDNKLGADDGQTMEEKLALLNRIRLWGHSHANMPVFASGTDEDQLDDFTQNATGDVFFLRLIANKLGDLDVTLCDYAVNTRVNHFGWALYDPIEGELLESVEREIEHLTTHVHGPEITTSSRSLSLDDDLVNVGQRVIIETNADPAVGGKEEPSAGQQVESVVKSTPSVTEVTHPRPGKGPGEATVH